MVASYFEMNFLDTCEELLPKEDERSRVCPDLKNTIQSRSRPGLPDGIFSNQKYHFG
jgi:hypothetical protein